jgi:phosphatidylserine/phosphatidylglycerophosphate/cardiolipin synthase-like enzyme
MNDDDDDRMILSPGDTCAVATTAPRSGLLIDGHDYYRAVYETCIQARREILMLGWQFDTRTPLLCGDDARGAPYPVTLLKFLARLCEERPDLRIFILAWESSPVFALEREPFQSLTFRMRSHCNLRFELDDCHPTGASQHQKLVVVDRSIAMIGGMDLCSSRWDDRSHQAVDPRRKKHWPKRGTYHPYHDVQAYVTGDAVDTLRDWFVERWRRGTREELVLCADAPREELELRPTVAIDVPRVALARTLPEIPDVDPKCDEVRELRSLHLRAIAAARSSIYIENQYFSSEDIRRALVRRMRQGGDPLEIAIVLPDASAGLKEQVTIGVRQAEILRQLKAVGWQTGHRVGVYYAAAPGPQGDVPVFIHAKVLAVDDRFLLVSSANTTNRSMGLDTELGLAWETDAADEQLREARVELMREHCGLGLDAARELLGATPGMIARLDAMARARTHRLRMHKMCEDAEPGRSLAHALGDDLELDPCNPMLEDLLPEPGRWYGHVRERLTRFFRALGRRGGKQLGARAAAR